MPRNTFRLKWYQNLQGTVPQDTANWSKSLVWKVCLFLDMLWTTSSQYPSPVVSWQRATKHFLLQIEEIGELTVVKKLEATDRKPSTGHSLNQSIVQQLTRDGNIRRRVLNASPNGLIAITIWRFFRHWSTKNINISKLDPSIPAFLALGRITSKRAIISSLAYKFGTCEHRSSLMMWP